MFVVLALTALSGMHRFLSVDSVVQYSVQHWFVEALQTIVLVLTPVSEGIFQRWWQP